ncbi:hypothetical protein EJ03DRAFT_379414 [Teratosphaeria nubilosa]|uniref:Mid2 domain-containing protein n=1 Tax=Teratosphaeria nubilosa TaxID=161662 RepID=A0A6G1LMV0_9PEZI|nr:hypothetical protein EJ03DRAFT_379414 [Teratosphaeria nubilosa]
MGLLLRSIPTTALSLLLFAHASRYTCTDQTWQSSACPLFCAYAGAGDNSPAAGDQALRQDDDGDWCCDYNRDASKPCTNQTDAVFFSLPSGTTLASISTLVPTTSAASVSNGPLSTTQGTPVSTAGDSQSIASSGSRTSSSSSSTTSSSAGSTTSESTTSSTTTSAQTSTISSSIVTTGSNGAATTIVTTEIQISTPTPASDPSPSPTASNSSHSNHVGLIAGVATGVPAFLLASAAITLIYLKRRRTQSKLPAISAAHNESYTDDFDKKYGTQVGSLPSDGRAPELDSYPIASPSSKDGSSELDASRPTSGVSAMTAGGLHSPAKSQGHGVSPASNLHVVNEENEPAELWGGYVPYRPPQGGLPPMMQPRRPKEDDGYEQ